MPVGDLIRARAAEAPARPFLRFGDARISFGEYHRGCIAWARAFLALRAAGPFHVGILLDNTPDYLFALGGVALAGAVAVGINNTKRGTYLARDIAHTDCQLLVTEPKYLPMLAAALPESGVLEDRVLVSAHWESDAPAAAPALGQDLDAVLRVHGGGPDPDIAVGNADPFVLVFTSGTVTAPKAVICSHGRMVETGKNIGANVYGMSADDTGYIAMPLFHANALMCGWMPALYYGASLGMIRKFSTSQWLADIRRYGATFFNYTGKPLAYILATPPQADDHVNPLRICYGNEGSSRVVEEFSRRFDCRVVDVFGSSEGGVGVTRQPGDPPTSIGMPAPGITVVNAQGEECPPARFDAAGRLLNAEDAVGEIVNTLGLAWFEGYYKNPHALAERTRNGWYWSADLGYRDAQGYLYFAGRDVEWLRVDGENFLGRPIELILQRHRDVMLAAVYGVPDPDGGDRVMAALVLREGAAFDAAEFAEFLHAQADLSPKWVPTYIRISRELPQTPSSKVLKSELRRQKFRTDLCHDPIYWRPRAGEPYRPFGTDAYRGLCAAFDRVGRGAMLEL